VGVLILAGPDSKIKRDLIAPKSRLLSLVIHASSFVISTTWALFPPLHWTFLVLRL